MLKITKENLAALSMTLSCQLGIHETNNKAMQSTFKLLQDAQKQIEEASVCYTSGRDADKWCIESTDECPKWADMNNPAWQVFMANLLTHFSALKKDGEDAKVTTEQCRNVFRCLEQAVADLNKDYDLAQKMAKLVLGPLYPED